MPVDQCINVRIGFREGLTTQRQTFEESLDKGVLRPMRVEPGVLGLLKWGK